ncbi:hypothetical protein [Croceimicrobium sp.]|uniref:hypothetical protein n=1 Tax=Croceimicrobium sp. TaxID=2828340 RepID=UPI003BAB04B9
MSKKIEDWTTEAVPMILNYQNDDSLFIPTAGGAKLKGLMVDAEHVLNIINNPDHNIKKLFMICALRGDTDVQQFTMVLAGVDEDGKLVCDPAYEYLEPCPSNCANLDAHL